MGYFDALGSAPSASEVQAGIAELATQTETEAGTDDLRIVTPFKFATATLLRMSTTEVSITGVTTLASTAFYKMHILTGTPSYTVTLPASPGAGVKVVGFRVPSTVASAVHITVNGNGANIDGVASRVLDANEVMILLWDGTNYHRITSKRTTLQNTIYTATTDVQNNGTVTAATWTNTITDQTFTVVDATSAIEFRLEGVINANVASYLTSQIYIDSTTSRWVGGGYGQSFLQGASSTRLAPGALGAGSHTVRVRVYSINANGQYLRASSQPNSEGLRIDVIEHKQ
jgi:hypothetical protein